MVHTHGKITEASNRIMTLGRTPIERPNPYAVNSLEQAFNPAHSTTSKRTLNEDTSLTTLSTNGASHDAGRHKITLRLSILHMLMSMQITRPISGTGVPRSALRRRRRRGPFTDRRPSYCTRVPKTPRKHLRRLLAGTNRRPNL